MKIDRTVLTGAEMQDILAGLRGLDSVNGGRSYGVPCLKHLKFMRRKKYGVKS